MKNLIYFLFLLPALLVGDIAVTVPASSFSSTSDGGVSSFGRWGSSRGGFQLSWNITQDSGGSYSYIYTISKDVGSGGLNKGIGSFILELNPSITAGNLSSVITNISTPTVNSPSTFTPGSSGASFLPSSIYGIQFDPGNTGVATISFTSTNAPVWGSFYAQNRTGSATQGYAYNTAFSSNPTASTVDFSNWVPTVGGSSVLAPEPGTMLLLGSTLVFLEILRRRRKASSKS